MKSKLLLILIIITFLPLHSLQASQDLVPAKVKDISDRAYEPAVIELLDEAKESIVISMYNISVAATKKGSPINFLLGDLLEARERGVEVTLYLNTKFGLETIKKDAETLIKSPIINELKDAGCVIHLLPKNRRLHDKLIIVDGRYVVEGSTNWSISGLRRNYESATLIDSYKLARIKLTRLGNMPLKTVPDRSDIRKSLYLEDLPDNIVLAKRFMRDKDCFSQMVTRHDDRAMDLYLLLLSYSQSTGETKFFIDLECMGLSLGLPDSWSDTGLRRQVIRSLRKLDKHYGLINVKFFYARDALVELIDMPGETFMISSKVMTGDLNIRLKFLLMAREILKLEGRDIYSMPKIAIARRFNISRTTVRLALKDLEKWEKKGR